jgi:uncharacterized protein YjiS (DUF1127 family)
MELGMNTESRPYPVVQNLIDSLAAWLKHRRELSEMRALDRTNLDRIANDLRISSDDLEELVRHGEHSSDELPEMLAQLGIDELRLAKAYPLLLRDMERVCGLCRDKAHCHSELAAGTAAGSYQEYCPNATTIEALDRASSKRA